MPVRIDPSTTYLQPKTAQGDGYYVITMEVGFGKTSIAMVVQAGDEDAAHQKASQWLHSKLDSILPGIVDALSLDYWLASEGPFDTPDAAKTDGGGNYSYGTAEVQVPETIM